MNVCVLACRASGTRLYGKPLQLISQSPKITILDNIVTLVKSLDIPFEIVLAIAEGAESQVFENYADANNIRFVVGPEQQVVTRFAKAIASVEGARYIMRITTESPFPFLTDIHLALQYLESGADLVALDDVIDGMGFEIFKPKVIYHALRHSDEFDNELVTRYARLNCHIFNLVKLTPPEELKTKRFRLTVDNPEDLVVCRLVWERFGSDLRNIPLDELINFLESPESKHFLCEKYLEVGYETMYL